MARSPYIPHTERDIEEMLDVIGVASIDELFSDLDEQYRRGENIDLPDGLSEVEVYARLADLAAKNLSGVSFLGAGCYDHLIPSTVSYIMSRSEFATAYTPYQAETSQGVLQAIFEYQTMIRLLTGLPVPNASLYDGATAATEACAMAMHAKKKSGSILVSKTVFQSTREIIRTYFSDIDIDVIEIPEKDGATDLDSLEATVEALGSGDRPPAGFLAQTPNMYGIVEELSGVSRMLHEHDLLFVVSSNPMALSVLANQAQLGADIAVGDAQPCGLPMSFGGPSVGYIAATEALMRKMPGRIVGETVDSEGKRAFVLTLQAREQHIKRARATSNICTNQALAALGVAVYLSTVGKQGFREIGLQNVHKAHYLADQLEQHTAARLAYRRPFFNEFVLKLPCPVEKVVSRFLEERFFAGVPMTELGGSEADELLVAVTEKRTRNELDTYVALMKKVIS